MAKKPAQKTTASLLCAALILLSAGLEPYQAAAQPRLTGQMARPGGVSPWGPVLQQSFGDFSSLPDAPGAEASSLGPLSRLEPLIKDDPASPAAAPLIRRLEAAGRSPAAFALLPAQERRALLAQTAAQEAQDLQTQSAELLAQVADGKTAGDAVLEASSRLDGLARLGQIYLEPKQAAALAKAGAALDSWAKDYRRAKVENGGRALSAGLDDASPSPAGRAAASARSAAAGFTQAVNAPGAEAEKSAAVSLARPEPRTAPSGQAQEGRPLAILAKAAPDSSQMSGSSFSSSASKRSWRDPASELVTAAGLLGVALVGGTMLRGLFGHSDIFPVAAGALALVTAKTLAASLAESRSVIVGGWQASHDQKYRVGPDGSLRDVRGHKYGSDRYEETAPGEVRPAESAALGGVAFAAGLYFWSTAGLFALTYAAAFGGLLALSYLLSVYRAAKTAPQAPSPAAPELPAKASAVPRPQP